MFDTMKMAVRRFLKVRVNTHVGSYAECVESLQKYGVLTQDFPLRLLSGPNGKPSSSDLFLDTEYHVEMMTKASTTRTSIQDIDQ
jgi:hypothetical protein